MHEKVSKTNTVVVQFTGYFKENNNELLMKTYKLET